MKPTIFARGLLFFIAGWAAANTGAHPYGSGHGWHSLASGEKIFYVKGFRAGYNSAVDANKILASSISGPNRTFLENVHRDMTGSGPAHVSIGQEVTAMSSFYSDYRNQPICWEAALMFSLAALNGQSATEEQLSSARLASARNGCH